MMLNKARVERAAKSHACYLQKRALLDKQLNKPARSMSAKGEAKKEAPGLVGGSREACSELHHLQRARSYIKS